MLTASPAKHSRSLTVNLYHNGHPDLVVNGIDPDNKIKAGSEGVEIKATRKAGGAVDTHGARNQWMCVFVYDADNSTEPAKDRAPMTVTEIYLGHVTKEDCRKNQRGELGTRTATLHKGGIETLRKSWVDKLDHLHRSSRCTVRVLSILQTNHLRMHRARVPRRYRSLHHSGAFRRRKGPGYVKEGRKLARRFHGDEQDL